MTTRVTIEPSGHRIEVVTEDGNRHAETVTLEAGEAPYTLYIHSTKRVVSIRELLPNVS